MKSQPLGVQSILATDHNTRRDDARGGSFLLAHQQLGALALPTNPTNGQTLTVTVNGTAILITYVSSIGSTPNNILIQSTAALTVAATVNFFRRPDITNANQVAAIVANQALLVYLGWSLPAGGTTITPFSLNKNVNSATGNLTSFTASTTVTGASWTAETMQLYVEDGTYFLANTRYLFTGGSTPTVTAPSSHPRIDVLTLDTTGTLAWTTGTESATPAAPTYPANKIPICELYNVVGETALYDNENQQSGEGYIYNDVRPALVNPYGLFILDPGSEAQGDVLYYNGSAWSRLPAGASGQALTTKGASANPIWQLPNTVASFDANTDNVVSVPTGSVETTIQSGTVTGLGPNDHLYIRSSFLNATNASTIAIQANGTDLFTFSATSVTTDYLIEVFVSSRNSASSQDIIFRVSSSAGAIIETHTTASANLGSPFTLALTAKQNTGISANFTAHMLSVFVLPG
jgi:hypothetical protein